MFVPPTNRCRASLPILPLKPFGVVPPGIHRLLALDAQAGKAADVYAPQRAARMRLTPTLPTAAKHPSASLECRRAEAAVPFRSRVGDRNLRRESERDCLVRFRPYERTPWILDVKSGYCADDEASARAAGSGVGLSRAQKMPLTSNRRISGNRKSSLWPSEV